jgi:catechol 2,3-dioxygenase
VSKAFYFTDRRGGVELYWDRDRAEWGWVHGQVEDVHALPRPERLSAGASLTECRRPPNFGEAVVGHVHLAVGDIDSAREFYVNRLGFEQTILYGDSALFVSAGDTTTTWQCEHLEQCGAGRHGRTLGLMGGST